jgi:hypothetical protein
LLVFKVGTLMDGSKTWWSSHVRIEPDCPFRYATKEENQLMRLVVEGSAKPKDKERLKELLADERV